MDLDKKRAARKREAKKEPVTVKFGGKLFQLPIELPFECVIELASLATQDDADAPRIFTGVLQKLLGKQYDEFMALGPSMTDVMELVGGLAEAYGISQGESPASAVS